MSVQIIQGGQYGSEAKGAVAAYLALHDRIDIAVRTGATNAGHTVFHNGHKVVMQQLPSGWVNPSTKLVIGAGALIDPEILRCEIREVSEVTGADIRERLVVDPRAFLHWSHYAKRSSESGRHTKIGATGKGCSEALIARLRLRGVENHTIGEHAQRLGLEINFLDTERYLNRAIDQGARVQLEGTQGQLLDLYLGPYPYTTHKQTGPGQWMLECGLSPRLATDIVMVVRTFPIRVAGNSGPLPQETSWPDLARSINEKLLRVALPGAEPPTIVPEWAILKFEEKVREVAASGEFRLPPGSDGLDQHLWLRDVRERYLDTLSNLNARAFSELAQEDSEAYDNLTGFFEMTTVTKKLRRVAALDLEELRRSARQIRPHRVVVTFMNYLFPERWGTNIEAPAEGAEHLVLSSIEAACGAPVELINRGPLPEHFARVDTR